MLAINNTKWKIIEELSKGNKTPTELAKKLKITLPSIHVQLRWLEQKRLIKRTGEVKGKTRPYAEYSIGDGFVYYLRGLPHEASQMFLPVDENLKLHLRLWSIPQKEYHYFLEKFWWEIQDYIDDIDAMIVYGSVARGDARKGADIDILLLVKKDVRKYEKFFGAKMVGPKGRQEMVMCQVFRTDDFGNSLRKGSDFAAEVLKEGMMIYDPCDVFRKLKDEP